jgi:hypothetical protein
MAGFRARASRVSDLQGFRPMKLFVPSELVCAFRWACHDAYASDRVPRSAASGLRQPLAPIRMVTPKRAGEVICAFLATGGNYGSRSQLEGIAHLARAISGGRCPPYVRAPPLADRLTRPTTWGQAIAGAGNRRVLCCLFQRAWPMAANVDLAPALALSRTSSFAPLSVDDEPNQPALSCR